MFICPCFISSPLSPLHFFALLGSVHQHPVPLAYTTPSLILDMTSWQWSPWAVLFPFEVRTVLIENQSFININEGDENIFISYPILHSNSRQICRFFLCLTAWVCLSLDMYCLHMYIWVLSELACYSMSMKLFKLKWRSIIWVSHSVVAIGYREKSWSSSTKSKKCNLWFDSNICPHSANFRSCILTVIFTFTKYWIRLKGHGYPKTSLVIFIINESIFSIDYLACKTSENSNKWPL